MSRSLNAVTVLKNKLASVQVGFGDALIGVKRDISGSVAETLDAWISRRAAYVEEFGAVGDGVADDTAAIQEALDSGEVVRLKPGANYFITESILPPSNGGMIGDGTATITMGTGAGEFDVADYVTPFASDAVGIYANGVDNITLGGFKITMEASASIRTCNAISVRDSENPKLFDIEAYGFQEAAVPIINLDSVTGGYGIDLWVHDVTTDDDTLPSMQLTGIGIDYNRLASVNTTGFKLISPRVEDITLGAAAYAEFGDQTDGINIQSQGGRGISIVDPYISNVGEGIDIFCDYASIQGGLIRQCQAHGIKLVHGAQGNRIVGVGIDGTGGSGVIFVGSNTSSKDTADNVCAGLNISNIGSIAGKPYQKAAYATDGSSATYQPKRNKVFGGYVLNGGQMDYVVDQQAGESNEFIDIANNGYQVAYARHTIGTRPTVRRSNQAFVKAYRNATGNQNNGDVVAYDAEVYDVSGEWDTANKRFTSKSVQNLSVAAKIRIGALNAGKYLSLRIRKNGTEVANNVTYNDSAGAREAIVEVSACVSADKDDYIDAILVTDQGAAVSVTGGAEFTSMCITEM